MSHHGPKPYGKMLFRLPFATSASLLAAAILAWLGTASLQASGAPSKNETEQLDTMIGQMIMVGFSGDDEKDEGVAAVRAQLSKGVIGGVALFPENIRSPEQVRNLIAFLRNARSNPVPFIAVDQEGGKVQRLTRSNGFKSFPSARGMGRNPKFSTAEGASRLYTRMASDLADAGFNMNFGPVVDLDVNPRNPVIGGRHRSYGADPATVTEFARTFIAAHREANVVPVAKHFPGHGSSLEDSHHKLADISKTWREIELEPYRQLAKEGRLDAVMIGHLYHPRFSDLEGQPASLSAKAVRALRNKYWIGFDGVVVTDDMEMGGVSDGFSLEERVVRAVKAGVDLIVISNVQTRDHALGPRIHAIIAKAVGDGRISRLRIEQAYGRIMLLKRRLMQKQLAGQ